VSGMAEQVKLAPAEGISVAWDTDAVRALANGESRQQPVWRLEGPLAPGFSALRVVSGATADGTLLLLCAARPEAAAHHDEEAVAAVLVSPEGESEAIEEALVSTEYAADGAIRRLGLELYKEGDDYPVRGAGDVTDTNAASAEAERRDVAELAFRLDGSAGAALYEIVHPA
jgi:hypothetical protein